MPQAHIFISGFVQGVGFRQFVKVNADNFGVRGFVRNLADGRVEALFVGDKKNIENIINECRRGPFLAEVENVDVVWEEKEKKFEEFEIRD